MMIKASVAQKAMWVSVSAMGNGNPAKASTYLFSRMTMALKHIHNKMYLAVVEMGTSRWVRQEGSRLLQAT